MEDSTFCDTDKLVEKPKKVRSCQTNSPFTRILENTHLKLIKIHNNAINTTTYLEVREIRKQFFNICSKKDSLSQVDKSKIEEIKKLLAKLKQSHPELLSKIEFKNSEHFESVKQATNSSVPSTTSIEYDNNCEISRNMLSSFIAQHSNEPQQAKQKVGALTMTQPLNEENCLRKNQQKTPVANDTESVKLSEDEIKDTIGKYRLWAIELERELELKKRSFEEF